MLPANDRVIGSRKIIETNQANHSPRALADTIKVSDGKRAEIKVENGALVLRPIVKPARNSSYTLDGLLSDPGQHSPRGRLGS